jgi:hypothetical protein
MAALTRILNNQIYNSTIVGHQKIVPGTLTGSLFASNVTVPGDLLIAGNLFVLGTSAYTAISSTNTYVNDPTIVLNNGYSATNVYDIGFIFNRGTSQNQAIIWDESATEFALVGTTDTGTVYGNIATSNYATLHVGNLTVDYTIGITTLNASGNVNAANFSTTGDLAVNGGDITTSATSFNLLNTGATTVTAFGAGNVVTLGATTGTLTVNNPTLVGSQPTQDIYNTVATTVNAFGAANVLTIGATSGTASIRNANIWFPNATTIGNGQDTVTLYPLPATVTTFNSGTLVTLGASTGTLVLNNPDISSPRTSVNLLNANVATLNLAGAGTLVTVGANTGTLVLNNPDVSSPRTLVNLLNANVVTLNVGGAVTNLTLSTQTGGTANIGTANISFPSATNFSASQSTIGLFNTPTTVNAFQSATALVLGSTAGKITLQNAITEITSKANVLSTADAISSTSAALTVAGGASIAQTLIVGGVMYANASAATTTQGTGAIVVPTGGISVAGNANIAGQATITGATQLNSTLTAGGITRITNTTNATDFTTGALIVSGGAGFARDVFIQGNLYVTNIAATNYSVLSVQDPMVFLQSANAFPYSYDIGLYSNFIGGESNIAQFSGTVRDATDGYWKFFSNITTEPLGTVIFSGTEKYDGIKAGNLVLSDTTLSTSTSTGVLVVSGGVGIAGNINHGGVYLDTSSSNYIFANTPATVDAFKSATALTLGATTGTTTIRSPALVGSQTTQNVFNTGATIVNFAGEGNVTMGAGAGVTAIRGRANVQATTVSVSPTGGALVVGGGIGAGGNIFFGGAYLGSTSSNFIFAPTPTTANLLSAATTIKFGSTSGDIALRTPVISSPQGTLSLFDGNVTTMGFAGSATTLVVGGTSGIAHFRNANIWLPNATTLDGSSTAISLFTQAATSASVLTQANVTLGGSVGVSAIQNPVIRLPNASNVWVGSTTLDFANTVVTTLNIAGDATQINLGATTGETNVRNSLEVAGVLFANSTASTTSTTSGSIVSAGGLGLAGAIVAGGSATFNDSLTSTPFQVKGVATTSLIYADTALGAIVFGGSNVTPTLGSVVKFNSTDTIQLPIGSSAQRPGNTGNVDLAGMLRFNTTINDVEYYNGTAWEGTSAAITVITDRQFVGNVGGGFGNVDGVNSVFTLDANATTASTLVTVDGIVQLPVTDYSVSGTTLTFVTPPGTESTVDARVLTTTTVIESLLNGDGTTKLSVSDSGVEIALGDTLTASLTVNTAGDLNLLTGNKLTYTQPAVNIVANNTSYVISTFSQTAYTTAKYVVSAKKDATNFESSEALVVTDGAGNAFVTTYGIINNGTRMGVISANVVAGNVNVYYTTTTNMTNANVKAMGTYIV